MTDNTRSEGGQLPFALKDSEGRIIKIVFREKDGYIDATELCGAVSKDWWAYYKTANTKAYLKALAESENMSIQPTSVAARNVPPTSVAARNEPIINASDIPEPIKTIEIQTHLEPMKALIELGKNRYVGHGYSTTTQAHVTV